MKKLAFLMAALAIVGCSKQGGTDDQYDSTTGRSVTDTTTNNSYNVTPTPDRSITDTNTSSTNTLSTPPLPQ
jgi:hypothetical protein